MHYEPQDGKWQVGKDAKAVSELRQRMTPEAYEKDKQALKEFLCGYFSSGDCRNAQGSSISPMKASPGGGKVLKVRWAYPGGGKSGSLRLVVVAYCDEKRFTSPRHSTGVTTRKTKISRTLSATCNRRDSSSLGGSDSPGASRNRAIIRRYVWRSVEN